MAVAVQSVVGEFGLVEVDRLGLPVRAECGAVGVDVDVLETLRFGATGRNPLRAGELEATVSNRNHLEQHAVVLVVLQARDRHSHRRKHSPAG